MKYLAAAILILLSLPLAMAEDNTTIFCSDDYTLTRITHVELNVTGVNPPLKRIFDVSEDVHCAFGCGQNECRGPPYYVYGIIFGVVILSVFLYWLYIRSK